MSNKKIRYLKIIVSSIIIIHWILASMVIFNIINGDGMLFPNWLDKILFPSYFLGLLFGFVSGGGLAFLIQILTLIFYLWLVYLILKKSNGTNR